MTGFLLACAAIVIPAALIIYLEWRSHPRDRRSAALRRANSQPINHDKGERNG